MREILFRGKRLENNAWVFGSFCMDAVEQKNGLCGVDGFIRLYDFAKGKMQMHEVDRETVGQFTGLLDKNGKRIFEDDIIKISHKPKPYEVKYKSGCYCIGINWALSHEPDCEVIGNIYDNPELLTKGD